MNKVAAILSQKMWAHTEELVLIPRREYEVLLRIKTKGISEVALTARQKRAILKSERELRGGEYLTLHELKKHLGGTRAKARR